MLLDAILIVLRETLEAGVLVSVLASLGSQRHVTPGWLWRAFALGIGGALLIALNLRTISEWFDGVGQEVVDALMQYAVYLSLLALLIALWRHRIVLRVAMIAAVALTVTREGSEILLFFSAYLQTGNEMVRALTSGFVGLMIGVSVGILIYFALTLTLSKPWAERVQTIVLPLLAAGMAMQASQLLLQADWLPAGPTLWNSNAILNENSLSGQLAYAVFGYEATPTATEITTYAGALLIIVIARALCGRMTRSTA